MQAEYVPHGYILRNLVRRQYALDVYEAVRVHDKRSVYLNRIRRDTLKTMELVDMELSIRHLPFVSNPYINKCLFVQRHNASSASYVIVDKPSSETLSDLIRTTRIQGERISEGKIWYILAQLLYALASIHSVAENQRLKNDSPAVHMDIRPSMIYVTTDGNYLLSVLSPNKFLHQASTEPYGSPVSPERIKISSAWTEYAEDAVQPRQAVYTAPEWFATGEYTAASDIWSLGTLLYELCTFEPLFVVPCDMSKQDVSTLLYKIASERRPIPAEYTDILRCTIYYMMNPKPINRPLLNDLFEMRQIVDMLQIMNKTPPETFATIPSPSSNPFISRMKTIERLCDTPNTNMSPDVLMDILDLATPSSLAEAEHILKSVESMKGKLRENDVELDEAQDPINIPQSTATAPTNPMKLTLCEEATRNSTSSNKTGQVNGAQPANGALCDDKTLSISELNPDKAHSLIIAVESGNEERIKKLIPTHAGRATLDGRTALMVASENSMLEIIRLLAPKEAKMTLKRPQMHEGETALMQAARRGLTPVVTILAPYEAKCVRENGQTALMIASQARKKDVVDVLIHFEHGLTDEDGWTALKVATNLGYLDIVETLVSFEAGIADDTGETALMIAANKGYLDIVNLTKHAEARMQTNEGQTALMCAAHKGHTSICETLALAESGLRKFDGTTALMCAAYTNSLNCVRILLPLEEGLQTNELHPKGVGYTALICALEQKDLSVARYILENSSAEREKYVTLPDGSRKTWVDFANELDSEEALALINKYNS